MDANREDAHDEMPAIVNVAAKRRNVVLNSFIVTNIRINSYFCVVLKPP
jgi:hypothetical protein